MASIAIHQDMAPVRLGAAAKNPGLLRRIGKAVIRAREKKVDRELAQYVQRSGGRLTDDIERQMMEQLYGNWNFRA